MPARVVSLVVKLRSPKPLSRVRFLHHPHFATYSLPVMESKAGGRRAEAGSRKFSPENYV